MFELIITDTIAAAHFLRGYKGRCENLHGHTWKIEVILISDRLDDIGMVYDFTELKPLLKEILSALDHKCLNDLPQFQEINPTTENMAKYIYYEFTKKINKVKVKQVRVWESETASAVYYE